MGTSSGQQTNILASWISISMGFFLVDSFVGSQINIQVMVKSFIQYLLNYIISRCNIIQMSVNTQTSAEPKPIKPLKPHKQFRNQRMTQQQPSQGLIERIKQQWKSIDPSVKQQMQQRYDTQMKKYLQDKQEWQKKYGDLAQIRKQVSLQKKEPRKMQRTKGDELEYSEESRKVLKKLKKKQVEQDDIDYDIQEKTEVRFDQRDYQQDSWMKKISTQEQFQQSVKKTKKPAKNNKKPIQDLGEQLVQEYKDQQLIINKKIEKGADDLIFKINKKADFFKNRLSFKEAEKDVKFKKEIKQQLKTLEEVQQIDLVVDVPKAFGNKGGALYLKNVNSKEDNLSQQVVVASQQSLNIKDRKNFYENFGKQLKMKRSETISESALKQCFKQSSLDDTDILENQYDLKKIQKPTLNMKQNNLMKKSLKQTSSVSSSSNIQMSNHQIQQKNQIKGDKQQDSKFNVSSIVRKQQRKQSDLQKAEKSKTEQPQQKHESQKEALVEQKTKEQKKRYKKQVKKGLRKHLRDYIEEQADNSGQQDKSNEGSCSDDSGDTDISSLIDNELQITQNDHIMVYNKFVRDTIEQQERQYQNMRKTMAKKILQDEENLKKRMKEAAKRNSQKQKEQTQAYIMAQPQELIKDCDTQNQSRSANNVKKIQKLQLQLGIKTNGNKIVAQKPEKINLNLSVSSIEEMQKVMINKAKNDIKKPARQGMKNMIQTKGFKPNIKTKQKR